MPNSVVCAQFSTQAQQQWGEGRPDTSTFSALFWAVSLGLSFSGNKYFKKVCSLPEPPVLVPWPGGVTGGLCHRTISCNSFRPGPQIPVSLGAGGGAVSLRSGMTTRAVLPKAKSVTSLRRLRMAGMCWCPLPVGPPAAQGPGRVHRKGRKSPHATPASSHSQSGKV